MIPTHNGRAFPIMPQPVAALLFSVNQQDERPSDISPIISHPLSLYHTTLCSADYGASSLFRRAQKLFYCHMFHTLPNHMTTPFLEN